MRISDWSSDVCSSDLSDYQVILVREAQAIKKWDALLSYAENPLPSTLLVFCHKYGTLDKRLKVTKMIVKNGTVLESKKLYEDKLPAWVSDYLQERGYRSDPRPCALISEYREKTLQKNAGERSEEGRGGKEGDRTGKNR